MQAITLTPEPLSAPELRERIGRLREQIQTVTLEYRMAKEKRRSNEVAALLRTKSELTRLLFQTQRELLHSFRMSPSPLPANPEPGASAHAVLYPE